ncbi:unnamed protein product [Gemmata massiliana]|uniref:Uncharacterized protein n=1 Tax=Gemmata massiliana TaxID=1210884 RepID=A0A6P2D466_9BACT|nr:unnamed protein product [Gemmata massiliana]
MKYVFDLFSPNARSFELSKHRESILKVDS